MTKLEAFFFRAFILTGLPAICSMMVAVVTENKNLFYFAIGLACFAVAFIGIAFLIAVKPRP